jgi:hypothetical protein
MEIEHLHMVRTGAFNVFNWFVYAPLNTIVTPVGTQFDVIHDLLLDGNGARANQLLRLNINQYYPHVYNCVGWDGSTGLYIFDVSSGALVENNAAYDSDTSFGFNFVNSANVTARNNTSYDNFGADYANIGATIGRYNRSSDATAADVNWAVGSLGNTINAVVLNDVQGVNDAVANFFDIVVGGPLDSAGEANAGQRAIAAVCIRNRPVPNHLAQTSVGPAEIPEPVVPPEPTPTEERRHIRQYVFRMTATGCRP